MFAVQWDVKKLNADPILRPGTEGGTAWGASTRFSELLRDLWVPTVTTYYFRNKFLTMKIIIIIIIV